jgi:gamma-glutamyltranspeptidase/glutathione hydrolase
MGRISLADCLKPAILYASDGYTVQVNVSGLWEKALRRYTCLKDEAHFHWFETFCPDGRSPRPGELFKAPGHAYTLEEIADSGAKSFYSGRIADRILDFARRSSGFYSEDDLASFKPEWVDPISVRYKGYDVWEIPPNGQGIVVLIALNILKGFDFTNHDCPYTVHRQIEAVKMAFADARRFIADQRHSAVPVKELISDAYADARRAIITDTAQDFEAGDPYGGGTVYLCTADGEGNMVSYIQSNFEGFGSAVVIPGTGIALNNRARCFSLDPSHPTALAPGKRPYNTIIPAFLSKNGEPVGPFGVMGAYMQPQGHIQVVMNCVDFHMNPQEALDAPRWQWTGEMNAAFEPGFDVNTAQKLGRMGHNASCALHPTDFGRGQIIWRTDEGTLVGSTEPRTDGCVEAW